MLSRETGYDRDYGQNPYGGYDDVDQSPFLYIGPETPEALPAMARVVTVDLNGESVAYPYEVLATVRAVNDTVGNVPIVVLWAPGTASALDANRVDEGKDVGAATTFSRELDGQTLTFALDGDRVLDEQTGSEWNVLGRAVSGSLEGQRLEPIAGINHFWFSWAAFRPETRIYRPERQTADAPLVTPGSTVPSSAGVIIVSLMRKNMFMVPTSSMDALSTALSHSTCVNPCAWAPSAARSEAA